MKYTMSRDYEALYALLCNGGEALGFSCEDGEKTVAHLWSFYGAAYIGYRVHGTRDWTTWSVRFGRRNSKESFIAECQRLNLEWLAPISADRIMEVVREWDEHDRAIDKMYEDVEGGYFRLRSRLSKLGLK